MRFSDRRLCPSKPARGVIFVELAVVLLVLVPLLLLTVDLSYALYEYQTLVKQTRAGARYGNADLFHHPERRWRRDEKMLKV